jgi:hypothetical protein
LDRDRFDTLLRLWATAPSRRQFLDGFVVALGVSALIPETAAVRKRKKKKRKTTAPLVFNTFGCVDVRQPCRGDDANCCSGLCDGKKPKKGKPDKSRCVAHDAQTCQPGQTGVECSGSADVFCTTVTGFSGQCYTTTGNAGFCNSNGNCFPCKKDADCQAYCGPQSACVPCVPECADEGGTYCVFASPGCDLP